MSVTEKSEAPDSSGQSGEVEHVNVVKRVHADGTVVLLDADAVGGELEEMPAGYFLSVEFIGTVTAVCLASICAYVGYVLPATTLSLINADIGPSASINWVATGWTLGSAWGFLLIGRLSDMLGRRWMVLSTTVLGLIGCIVGCAAQSVGALIGSSVLNGVAAAAQLSFGIILGELVPNKHRGPIVALAFLSSMPFAVFGPVISRLFILNTSAGWRWSYYIGVILSVITVALYYFFYHPPSYSQLHAEGKTKRQQLKELDFVGIVLFTAGITIFLIGISWGGTSYPWKSSHVVAMIVVGGLVLIAFALYEQYFCKVQPLMPPRLFKNIGFSAIVMIAGIGAMVYYSQTVLWPQVIQYIYTTDTIKVGLQSSVIGGGVLLGQTIAGISISYVPKVKIQTVMASCLACAFIGSLASITGNDHARIIVLAIIGNASIGFVDNIAFPGVTLVWEAQDIGLATGVLGSLRAIGGAIAQSLYTSIFSTKVAEYMAKYVTPAAIAAGLPDSSISQLLASASTGDYSKVPGMTTEILDVVTAQVKRTYVDSFSIVFYVTIPFGVLLIASSLFVPNMEKFLGNNVARRLQGKGFNVGAKAKPTTASDGPSSGNEPRSSEKHGTEQV